MSKSNQCPSSEKMKGIIKGFLCCEYRKRKIAQIKDKWCIEKCIFNKKRKRN